MIHFFTIVLDGMPFIKRHYDVLRRLNIPWTWHVSEGVAHPHHCTAGSARITARLSIDGTTRYLEALAAADCRVHHYVQTAWAGKIEMVNASMTYADRHPPDLVWEIDSDEIWTTRQIHRMHALFARNLRHDRATFWCRYFVGPDIVTTTRDTWGNLSCEGWRRVWRHKRGFRFARHEPPEVNVPLRREFLHDELEARGLVFDHYGYATVAQVAFKEVYYGKPGLEEGWYGLLLNKHWPARLCEFWPWIDADTVVDRVLPWTGRVKRFLRTLI